MDTGRPEPEQSASAGQPTFGALLRQYRLVAGLSQEELAERAGLSAQALSALENGRRQAPYRHTVALLITAMGLAETEAAALAASVIRPRVPTGAAAGETPVDSANPAIVPDLPAHRHRGQHQLLGAAPRRHADGPRSP
jgi:transcriptional regulator with XRE-family HTH domain